ncbi:MAG: EAL domain-containing protein [Vibrio sp.]
MPNTIAPKTLKSVLTLFFIPLPIILLASFYLSEISIKKELDVVAHAYVHQIEEIVDELRDENLQALYDATSCRQIQDDLLFEPFLREVLIVTDGHVECSSRREASQINYKHKTFPEYLFKTGEYLYDVPYSDEKQTSLLVVNQDKNRPDRAAISVIDKNYIDIRLGLKDDDRLSDSHLTVSGATYPKINRGHNHDYSVSAYSKYLNLHITVEPSQRLKQEYRVLYLLTALPISILVSIFIYLISFWYKTKGSLLEDLKRALKEDELFLHYQPLVDSKTGKIQGVEALVRWEHPRYGFISPDTFIPIAEDNRLINKVTDYILDRAVSDWQNVDKTDFNARLEININVPPSYLSQSNCLYKLDEIRKKLRKLKLDFGIEITERQALLEPERRLLTDIQSLGVSVSIDDFGTGHTSLSILQDTDFDCLKIDRCFVNTIGIEAVNSTVLYSIIQLAHNMKVDIVAEGIETQEQVDFLTHNGVQLLQGYFLYKPMSVRKVVQAVLEQEH